MHRWTPLAHRLYFQSGLAPFKKHSSEYDDFELFFDRYERAIGITDDEQTYRKVLELFLKFKEKKRIEMIEKMKKSRASLPIKQYQSQIVDAVKQNRVVLIAADTGAGKSTQVPQYLMEAGFDRIACTQPRRIACYSLAKRTKFESLTHGDQIGYQVRFEKSRSSATRVLFLTEGVLLRQFSSDRFLNMYNVIIVDEVHERHITGDFLLGILKTLLLNRLDLRIVLMSATINIELFQQYFNAPIIQVPGRMYPVKIHYLPVENEDLNLTKIVKSQYEHTRSIPSRATKLKPIAFLRILERIDEEIPSTERGDVLVFVSGMNEITTVSEELKKYAATTRKWIILELHSSLPVSDQEKVFDMAPEGIRKCIISTNIAETSVTIDGIRFVIDSGKAKEMALEETTGTCKLSEFWISKSSAKQRQGRAGRTGPGVVYRFYSEKEYNAFLDFPVPEIHRMPIDSICLEIVAFGLGDPREFDFIEKPGIGTINRSMETLVNLGCLDYDENVTNMGKMLVSLPIDLILGKMLILAAMTNFVGSVTVIASILSVQSPFTRVADSEGQVAQKRTELHSTHGDIFTLLNIYTLWLELKLNNQNTKSWCKARGIEEQRMYEISKLEKQFSGIIKEFRNHPDDVMMEEGDVDQNVKETELKTVKRLLAKRKRESSSTTRKILKFEDDLRQDSDDDEQAEATIEELEFKMTANPKQLYEKSDVSMLSERDIIILKLILCSGLYPNIAIPDESNYSRPASEQMYHTKTNRHISMNSFSVFTFRPELLQGFETDFNDSMCPERRMTEVVCFMKVLETHKPFIMNPLKIKALPVSLLFAQKLDISSDFCHLIVDEWLHIQFFDSKEAMKALELGLKLRYSWLKVVDRQLQIWSKQESVQVYWKQVDLSNVPQVISSIRKAWLTSLNDNGLEDIIDDLVEFVELETDYHCSLLKVFEISNYFGYNPYANGKEYRLEVTPQVNYHMIPGVYPKSLLQLPILSKQEFQKEPILATFIPSDTGERMYFNCLGCHKSLLLTQKEKDLHVKKCIHY